MLCMLRGGATIKGCVHIQLLAIARCTRPSRYKRTHARCAHLHGALVVQCAGARLVPHLHALQPQDLHGLAVFCQVALVCGREDRRRKQSCCQNGVEELVCRGASSSGGMPWCAVAKEQRCAMRQCLTRCTACRHPLTGCSIHVVNTLPVDGAVRAGVPHANDALDINELLQGRVCFDLSSVQVAAANGGQMRL